MVESFLSGVVLQVLLLITGIIAARALGDEGRGQQALILVVALTASQIGLAGLPLALTFEAARGRTVAKRWLSHVAPVAAGQVVIVFIVFLVLMTLVFADRVPAGAVLVTLPTLPATIWQTYGLAVVQGHHQFRALHVLRLIPPALYAGGLVGVHVLFKDSVTAVMAVCSFSFVVGALITHLYNWRSEHHYDDGEERESEPEILPNRLGMARFGAVAFLGASSPLEVFRVDQLAVGLVLSTIDLALYTTAIAFSNFPRFLTQALGLTAYARISTVSKGRIPNRLVMRYVVLGTVTAIVVSAPLAIFAGPLIELTFGPEFTGATSITRILLVATVILCARRIISDCLRGASFPSAGSTAEITSLLTLVPSALIFVPWFGLQGFGFAVITCYSAGLVSIVCSWVRRSRNQESADLD